MVKGFRQGARRLWKQPKNKNLSIVDRKAIAKIIEDKKVSNLTGQEKIITDFLYGHAMRVLEATGRGEVVLHRLEAQTLIKELNGDR